MQPIIEDEEVSELKAFVKHRFTEIAETYLRCAAEYVAEILEGYEKKDAVMIVDAAHPLKSSSGNLGLRALSSLSQDLEEGGSQVVAGEQQIEELEPMVAKLQALYDESAEALKKYI